MSSMSWEEKLRASLAAQEASKVVNENQGAAAVLEDEDGLGFVSHPELLRMDASEVPRFYFKVGYLLFCVLMF